jgi:hypothetical protein
MGESIDGRPYVHMNTYPLQLQLVFGAERPSGARASKLAYIPQKSREIRGHKLIAARNLFIRRSASD